MIMIKKKYTLGFLAYKQPLAINPCTNCGDLKNMENTEPTTRLGRRNEKSSRRQTARERQTTHFTSDSPKQRKRLHETTRSAKKLQVWNRSTDSLYNLAAPTSASKLVRRPKLKRPVYPHPPPTKQRASLTLASQRVSSANPSEKMAPRSTVGDFVSCQSSCLLKYSMTSPLPTHFFLLGLFPNWLAAHGIVSVHILPI